MVVTWAMVGWAVIATLSLDVILACVTLALLLGCHKKPVMNRKERIVWLGIGCFFLACCVWCTPVCVMVVRCGGWTPGFLGIDGYIAASFIMAIFTLPMVLVPYCIPWDRSLREYNV